MVLTTSVTLAPASTSRPNVHAYEAEHGLSSLQLGAILGSVAVVLVLVLAGGICWAHRRRTRVVEYTYDYSRDPYDAPSSDGPPHEPRPGRPRYPPPVAEFIPGGARYPTYTAVPIRNPRTPRKLGRVYH